MHGLVTRFLAVRFFVAGMAPPICPEGQRAVSSRLQPIGLLGKDSGQSQAVTGERLAFSLSSIILLGIACQRLSPVTGLTYVSDWNSLLV